MFNDTDLPETAIQSPGNTGDMGAERPAAAPPARFGRLALCVAAASALACGVMGTVAYGVWFNHDQQVYAEAMAGARQALGMAALPAAGPPSAKLIAPAKATTSATASHSAATPDEEAHKQASWSGPVIPLSTPAARQTTVADTTHPVAASSATVARRTAPPSNAASQQQLASGRPGRDARLAQQERRSSSTANAGHKDNLFARMGSFFRRVNYRQHDTGNRQDIYSHP
jgi:hypothetical protein